MELAVYPRRPAAHFAEVNSTNHPAGLFEHLLRMTEAHRRQKQPEVVRNQLLAVARLLLVGEGAHAVTLDEVSRRAGVTKGGLQHHFPSKKALLDALSDQLFAEFEDRFARLLDAEPATPGRNARAYIRTCFDRHSGFNETEMQLAIGLLALGTPEYRQRWNERMKVELATDHLDVKAPDLLLVCRLAADGFWFSQMLGVYDIDEPRRAEVLSMLLKLCNKAVK